MVLPFAACRSTDVESTHDALLEWAGQHALTDLTAVRQVFAATRIGEFSSFAYPFTDLATRVLIDSWVLWTLIVDQLFEEKLAEGTLHPVPSESCDPETVLRAVAPAAPPEPHIAVLEDLSRRTPDGMPDQWQQEFRAHVALFLRSCHAEAVHRVPGASVHIDMPTFVRLRRGSFATDLFLDLVEKVYGVGQPHGPWAGPVATELRACAADVGGWCNDLLSYRRERGEEDRNNLVLLLAREHDCPVDEAFRDAYSRVHDRSWQFLDGKADLARCLREEGAHDEQAAAALQWALGIELLVSGSLRYQQVSRRWQEQ
ncbi:terpene synthase family protein [Streptomyces olivoreticuli]